MKKKTILDFQKMKASEDVVSWITAYDFPTSYCAEQAGIDMILVGDSGGMTVLGYESTNPVTMDEMIFMSKAARRGAPNTFLIGDMPQGSYEVSNEDAVRNALRFIKEAGCDAVKLEGGKRVCDRVKTMVDAGISVIGHLGLTPQSTTSFGGYRVQGKTYKSFKEIEKDTSALIEAGIFVLLLEAMPTFPSVRIKESFNIPVMGVGAGKNLDGQLVIMHDLLGFYSRFRPHFAKCYIPDVLEEFSNSLPESIKDYGKTTRMDGFLGLAIQAIKLYIRDVKQREFPSDDYCYPMTEDEINKFTNDLHKDLLINVISDI
jgi:3-methyl-2-oxobutanoate hydroxymethyltransferase